MTENKPRTSVGRRALVQAGWAVPAILAIGLPRIAKAGYGYGHPCKQYGGDYKFSGGYKDVVGGAHHHGTGYDAEP